MGPNGWQNAGEGAMGNSGGNFNWGQANGAIGGILGGLFGPDQSAPYQAAGQQYQQYMNQAIGAQQPYAQAGQNALTQYQNWLNSQQNAPGYVNSLMSQYHESPYAQYLQQQNQRAGINAGSASGMVGSTPFAQQMQQNANGISSGDLNSWLQNVLGINSQYGHGVAQQIGWGQNAANNMSGTYNSAAQDLGNNAFNQQNAQNQQQAGILGNIGSLAGDALGWFGL